MIKKEEIFPIGIGTFRLDLNNKEGMNDALLYSLENGQNYFDVSSLYENGKVMTYIGEFLSNLNRSKLFICCKISNDINTIEDISLYLDKYLKMLQLDYVDCLEFHEPAFSKIPLLEAYQEIKRLVDKGLVKYIGISNCNLEQLTLLNEHIGIDIFDGVYNLECKYYEKSGVLDYCKKNNIIFVCYQPLRRNRTAKRNYPIVVELANKYHKTQNQVIINWIVKEKGIIPIIKSSNIDRIKENIEALNFDMDKNDMDLLNQFESKEFSKIVIDWDNNGGITIDKLANQYD